MSTYLKLEEAPRLFIPSPQCGTCSVDVESTGDDWKCPVCGTSWAYDADDDDQGTLYEEWSGEELDSDVVDIDTAEAAGRALRRKQEAELFARLGIKL